MKNKDELKLELQNSIASAISLIILAATEDNIPHVLPIINACKRPEVIEHEKKKPILKLLEKLQDDPIKEYLNNFIENLFQFIAANKEAVSELCSLINQYFDDLNLEKDMCNSIHQKKAGLENLIAILPKRAAVLEEKLAKEELEENIEPFIRKLSFLKGINEINIQYMLALKSYYSKDFKNFENFKPLTQFGLEDHLRRGFLYLRDFNEGNNAQHKASVLIEVIELFHKRIYQFENLHKALLIHHYFDIICRKSYQLILNKKEAIPDHENILQKLKTLHPNAITPYRYTRPHEEILKRVVFSISHFNIEEAFNLLYEHTLGMLDIKAEDDTNKMCLLKTLSWINDELFRQFSSSVELDNLIQLQSLKFSHAYLQFQNKLCVEFLNRNQIDLYSTTNEVKENITLKETIANHIANLVLILLYLDDVIKFQAHKHIDKLKNLDKVFYLHIKEYAEHICEAIVLHHKVILQDAEYHSEKVIKKLREMIKDNTLNEGDAFEKTFKIAFDLIDRANSYLMIPKASGITPTEIKMAEAAADAMFKQIEADYSKELALLAKKKSRLKKKNKSQFLRQALSEQNMDSSFAEKKTELTLSERYYDDGRVLLNNRKYQEAFAKYSMSRQEALKENDIISYEKTTIELAELKKVEAGEIMGNLIHLNLQTIIDFDKFTHAMNLYYDAKNYAEEVRERFESEVKERSTEISPERQGNICQLSIAIVMVLDDIDERIRMADTFLAKRIKALEKKRASLLEGRLAAKKYYQENNLSWTDNPHASQYYANLETAFNASHTATQAVVAELDKTHKAVVHTANQFFYIHGQKLLPPLHQPKSPTCDFTRSKTCVSDLLDNIRNLPQFRELQRSLQSSTENLRNLSLIDAPLVNTLFKPQASTPTNFIVPFNPLNISLNNR